MDTTPDRDPPSILPPGTRIARYAIRELVAAASDGMIYQAEDPERGAVALKVAASSRPAAQGLVPVGPPHANVLGALDSGVADGRAYLATELVRGTRLDQWLDEAPRTWREILDVFTGAGRGLAAAHAAGTVHGDFKPENVIVGGDGQARVSDFGWAQAITPPAAPASPQAEPAAIAGAPEYMAPERFRGRAADELGDQFSFCVALYRALYRQQPFDPEWAASRHTLGAARRTPLGRVHFGLVVRSLDRATLINLAREVIAGNLRPAPPDTDVPGWLDAAIRRGLRADRADRHASMEALLETLGRGPEGAATDVPAPSADRRRLIVVAVGAVVLTAAGMFLATRASHK